MEYERAARLPDKRAAGRLASQSSRAAAGDRV